MRLTINFLAIIALLVASGNLLAQGTAPVNEYPGPTFSDTLNCLGTPTFEVDLTGQPSGTWLSDPQQRDGDCCGTDNNCVQFVVTLDPSAEGILFTVPDGCGAAPSGSLFYQVDCGPLVSVGTPLCLNGTGPFVISFCKPGNNENCYSIESIPAPSSAGDVITADGCTDTLQVFGLDPASVTWTSLAPGATGDYNGLLSNEAGTDFGTNGIPFTGYDLVVVTPGFGSPSVLTYEVCGNVVGACSSAQYCDTVSVTIYPTLFADAGPDVAICNGTVTGADLVGTAIGGTAPYTYTWTGPATQTTTSMSTTDVMTVFVAGEYILEIMDATGCPVAYDTVLATEYFVDIIADAGPDITVCGSPVPTVSINSSVSATNQGIWSGGAGTYSSDNTDLTLDYTPSAGEISAGSVTLTLTPTNALGCPYTTDDVVINLTQFTSTLSTTSTNISCFGLTDGTIDLTVTPGSPAYATTTYDWTTSGGSGLTAGVEDQTGLGIGTYDVLVTDVNGCVDSIEVIITEPPLLTIAVDAFTNETCDYSNDGTIQVSAAGGTVGYTYQIISPAPSASNGTGTFTGLTGTQAGTVYTIQVTDANGCTETVDQTITEPAPLTLTVDAFSNESCDYNNDGSIQVTAAGGNLGYTYQITSPTPSATNGTGTFAGLTGTQAGTLYTLEVTDANGCAQTVTQTITEPAPLTLTVDAFTNETCDYSNDGSIQVSAGGGTISYTYQITAPTPSVTNGTGTFSGLTGTQAGTTYTIEVVDANSCTQTVTQTITEPAPLTLTVASFANETCDYSNDGSIQVSAAGGTASYTYQITAPVASATNGTGAFTGLTGTQAGTTYTMEVVDANGCTQTVTQTITEPAPLTLVVSSFANESCDYNNDGSIQVSAAGGTTSYTYQVTLPSPSATNATGSFSGLTGTQAGTLYTLEVSDANGCTQTVTQTITEPAPLLLTVDAFSNESCENNNDGSIQVSAAGGTTSYTYQITSPSPSATNGTGTFTGLTGTQAGTSYIIEVVDANGCTQTVAQTITEPAPLTLSVSSFTNETCDYSDDGTIQVSAAGGTAAYTYQITLPAPSATNTTGTFTALTGTQAGTTYTMEVVDANGCTQTVTQTITEPTPLSTTLTPSVYGGGYNVTGCAQDGTLDLSVSGGNSGYNFDWSTDGIDGVYDDPQNLSGLGEGWYYVNVQDVNGCLIADSFYMDAPDIILVVDLSSPTYTSGSNISCYGLSDGSINLEVTGATGPYTYDWSNDGTGDYNDPEDPTGLPAGLYTLSIMDQNGCTKDTMITLIEPQPLGQAISAFTYPSGDNISCYLASDGSIDYTPAGGSPGYTYDWDFDGTGDFDDVEDPSGLPAGTYTVTIQDINGCSIDTSITLVQPTPLTQSFNAATYPSGDNISCFGLNDGSIDYTVGGGSPGYTYDWDTDGVGDNDDLEDIGTLIAGTYNVIVTDINGCTIDTTITLVEPLPLTQSSASGTFPSGDNISCFGLSDGSIDYTITGGSAGYTYDWDTDGIGDNDDTEDLSGLPAGTYSVQVTDINGCTIDTMITLVEPLPLNQNITAFVYPSGDNISCNGLSDGSIDYTVSGGSPGYLFDWDNDGIGDTDDPEDISSLPAGTYTVTAIDINGCTITKDIILTEPTPLVIGTSEGTYPSGDNISCFGESDGSIDLTVSGGSPTYSYTWSTVDGSGLVPANEDQTALTAGTYVVDATDINGCVISTTVTLVEPTDLTSVTSVTSDYNGNDVSCAGASDGAIAVSAANGSPTYVFEWFDANMTSIGTGSTANNLSPGMYYTIIQDINGCQQLDSVTVNDAPGFNYNVQPEFDYNGYQVSCYGASDGGIDLTFSGGTPQYTYFWTDGDGNTVGNTEDLTGLPADTYSVTITDANGCFINTSIILTEPQALSGVTSVTSNYNGSQISCNGQSDGAIDVVADGGVPNYNYVWTDATGGQIGNNDLVQGVPAGTYTVEISDANGCTFTTDILVEEPTPVTATLDIVSDYNGYPISCAGVNDGEVCATGTGGTPGGYNYLWDTNPPTQGQCATDLGQGTYTVTIVDVNGCVGTEQIFLQGNPPPTLNPAPAVAVCQGALVTFQSFSNPEDQCQWTLSNGMVIDDCGPNTLYIEEAGCLDATLTVTGELGCVDSVLLEDYICILSNPIAQFYADPWIGTIVESDISFWNTSIGGDYYLWDFGDGGAGSTDTNPQHDFGGSVNDYAVTLIAYSIDGCSDTIVEYVSIDGEVIFYVPNTFTPDDDDYNEYFKPVFNEAYLPENIIFMVFNRWGELVFQADTEDEIREGWDGTYKGRPCQDGTYTWKLQFKDTSTDKKEIHTGHVNIIK